MPEKHFPISPSSLYRVLNCPGSLKLAAMYESESSSYADEGTLAHDLAARRLRGEKVDATCKEMDRYVDGYVKFVLSQDGETDG